MSSSVSSNAEPIILKETVDYLVLSKPSGWHSTAGKSAAHTLEDWLKKNFLWSHSLPESGLIHRLDQNTSGCILVAKNLKAFKELQHRFRKGLNIKKIYWAYTQQRKDARPPLEFSLYFSSRYKSSKKVTVKESGARKNLGLCKLNTILKTKNRYLFEVELVGAGQRHQIRAGLAHLGFSILGDRLYGGSEADDFFGLHAFSISLGAQKIQAPPPKNWYTHIPLEKLHL